MMLMECLAGQAGGRIRADGGAPGARFVLEFSL